jgi:hypothetical protein
MSGHTPHLDIRGGDFVACCLNCIGKGAKLMKRFLAVYIGTEAALAKAQWNTLDEEKRKALEASGVKAWMEWGVANSAAIVDQGSPLGKTKRASAQGIAGIQNSLTGYVIVQAESHEAAARLFENHPHFTIFPGDSVEIMECLRLPRQ